MSIWRGPVFLDEIPEVVNFTRVDRWDNVLTRVGDRTFLEDHFYWADSGFFEIFSFPLFQGDPARVLDEPRSMVISESTAKKYFGNEDPMGKTLEVFSGYLLPDRLAAECICLFTHGMPFNIVIQKVVNLIRYCAGISKRNNPAPTFGKVAPDARQRPLAAIDLQGRAGACPQGDLASAPIGARSC